MSELILEQTALVDGRPVLMESSSDHPILSVEIDPTQDELSCTIAWSLQGGGTGSPLAHTFSDFATVEVQTHADGRSGVLSVRMRGLTSIRGFVPRESFRKGASYPPRAVSVAVSHEHQSTSIHFVISRRLPEPRWDFEHTKMAAISLVSFCFLLFAISSVWEQWSRIRAGQSFEVDAGLHLQQQRAKNARTLLDERFPASVVEVRDGKVVKYRVVLNETLTDEARARAVMAEVRAILASQGFYRGTSSGTRNDTDPHVLRRSRPPDRIDWAMLYGRLAFVVMCAGLAVGGP